MWDVCSVLLGTGNLFVWFGVLRYLGFFRTYNMLIVTLKKAFPSVLRFLLCAMLIYAGFTFCGWLIFGPYHFKVRLLTLLLKQTCNTINPLFSFYSFKLFRLLPSAFFRWSTATICLLLSPACQRDRWWFGGFRGSTSIHSSHSSST